MLIFILYAFIIALGWLIVDRIRLRTTFDIRTTWKKYIGAMLAGIIYIFLKELAIFQYLVIAGIIILVGHCFDAVVTWICGAIAWVRAKFGSKKTA